MKIAIVEDNLIDSKALEEKLREFSLLQKIKLEILSYSSGEGILADWPSNFNIVFLDIQMAGLNGIEVAKKIRESNERVEIIFVTNNPQHSLMGYSVEALDYLIKPVSSQILERVMARALRRLGNADRETLAVHNNEGYFVVNLTDIYFFEVKNRKLFIETKNGQVAYAKTLQYLEEHLPKSFFRCHSAFLINLHAVESIQGQYCIIAGKKIPISKHRRKDLISSLTDMIGGQL
jgi:DNA-binding LytR/AlgR family response regulator